MIPKQLFFIWFGKEVPKFAYFSLNSFKEMNTDFCIDLIHYTIDDVVNCHDSVLNYTKNLIFLTKKGIKNKYFDYIKLRIQSKFNFIQILSDVIRFELLYYYGGIYCDCDLFPVKRFDPILLNNTNFTQGVMCFRDKKYNPKHLSDDNIKWYDVDFMKNPLNYHCYVYGDIYFIGAKKEYTPQDLRFNQGAVFNNLLNPPWIRNLENTKDFLNLKRKFYNCELQLYKDMMFYSQYVLHLCNKSWQNDYRKSPMYCEYDDFLYGE